VWSISVETKKLFQEITLIIDGQSITLASNHLINLSSGAVLVQTTKPHDARGNFTCPL